MEAFKANLAARPSATESLRIWCERQNIARPAEIVAHSVGGRPPVPPRAVRTLLGVTDKEALAYRHVQLACGDIILSKAHNWYVPGRLSATMNRQLRETDMPFGKVVSTLGFRRHSLSSSDRGDRACPRDTVLANRALLQLPDGSGLAVVIECYTAANL